MRQYFAKGVLKVGDDYFFTSQQSHHLRNVLRAKSGDEVRIVDEDHHAFLGVLAFDGEEVSCHLLEQAESSNEDREIVCCAALIKKDKWEWLLQKASELGASKVVPLITKRTIISIEEKDLNKKLDRWNKLTLEACQQCNRDSLCEVVAPIRLTDIDLYQQQVNVVAYEKETETRLIDVLDDGSICFVVGPEGGLEESEVALLQEKGFQSVSLGNRILRAETASMFVLSVIEATK